MTTTAATQDQSKYESVTNPHKTLARALITGLVRMGYTGELDLEGLYAGWAYAEEAWTFKAIRGDLVLEKIGLVIEVDGSAHYKLDERMRRDALREHRWKDLDMEVHVVENHELRTRESINAAVERILTIVRTLEADPEQPKRENARRVRIHRRLAEFKLKNPNGWPKIFAGQSHKLGSARDRALRVKAADGETGDTIYGKPGRRHRGGIRFRFSSKRPKAQRTRASAISTDLTRI